MRSQTIELVEMTNLHKFLNLPVGPTVAAILDAILNN